MTAIDGALELRPQRDPLEIRVHEVEKALYVPSVEEFVQSAHGLDVLLRHSPRSISRKVALSMRGRSPSTSVASRDKRKPEFGSAQLQRANRYVANSNP